MNLRISLKRYLGGSKGFEKVGSERIYVPHLVPSTSKRLIKENHVTAEKWVHDSDVFYKYRSYGEVWVAYTNGVIRRRWVIPDGVEELKEFIAGLEPKEEVND